MNPIQSSSFVLMSVWFINKYFRRKGDNAQQVIDLSAAVKQNEVQLAEKQSKILALEAELVGAREDLKAAESQIREVEETSQLLKDEYQALQLALSSAEAKLR